MKRSFGRLGREITTLGMGGQASIQWTPPGVDPVKIILKAFSLGVNYFDTSNAYGPSQMNYGKAFKLLDMIPGKPGYNGRLRKSIFLTTKTGLRFGKRPPDAKGWSGFTNGPKGSFAADDVRRSLSQMFGDGKGNYPKGAYLDMVLVHAMGEPDQVGWIYTGLEGTNPGMEEIGVLATLRDLRDGSNLTGLNPKEEKLIRHIGFSGHKSPEVMMEIIRRDKENLLDGMLIAINANDRRMANMQYNAIPVAQAKDMGVIAMKVFADGAMYGKEKRFSKTWEDVIRTVGIDPLPSRLLVGYALTTPGIHTAIIGTGHISDEPGDCQLEQNLSASQMSPDGFSRSEREAVEFMTASVDDGKTNYFQDENKGLQAPGNPQVRVVDNRGMAANRISWDTSIAGDQPLDNYEILRDGKPVGSVNHKPQTTMVPFSFTDQEGTAGEGSYEVVAVDVAGRRSPAGIVLKAG